MDFLLFFISIMLGTFTSVSTILSDTFQKQFVQFNLQFKTIPAYSPWTGACWERLIGVVKNAFLRPWEEPH